MKELTKEEKAKLDGIANKVSDAGALLGSLKILGSDTSWIIGLAPGGQMFAQPVDKEGKPGGDPATGSAKEIMECIYTAEFAARVLGKHFQEIRDGAKEKES